MFFLIAALRAVVELVGLCLLGQGLLHMVIGKRRESNPIYLFFAIVTRPPRRLMRAITPSIFSDKAISALTFIFLLILWIGLALLRKML